MAEGTESEGTSFYNLFFGVFVALVLICTILRFMSRTASENLQKADAFKKFQLNYLIIYFIVMGADWLQGPYVYALYETYGFAKSDIGILFIGGFLSSMVFGTFVGSLADKYGRRLLCVFFGIFYSISCLTKLINDFWILLIGRVLSGIATSLLFSSFESWMISEHRSRGFAPSLLSDTFSLATFGNGIVAIVAGLVASAVADYYGFVAPFMVSLGLLILGSGLVFISWSENYGDSTIDVSATFSNALTALKQDIRIPLLGTVQSLFEGAMYTFVFMWTPALKAGAEAQIDGGEAILPYGLIFACYMVSIMIGSSIFGVLLGKFNLRPEDVCSILLGLSFISFLIPVFTTNLNIVLFGFLLFEVCCGIYFPCMGTLRGKYIPEATRSAIMNFFRVPLNFLVVVVLVKVGEMKNSTVFTICALWLGVAFVLQNRLKSMPAPAGSHSSTHDEGDSLVEGETVETGGH